jgi:hypothetical protein
MKRVIVLLAFAGAAFGQVQTVTNTTFPAVRSLLNSNFTYLDTNKITGLSASVDSEVLLFSGTGGKTIKRASLTGIPYMTSGVLGAATSTHVISLFASGSCSGYLKSDGTCETPSANVIGQASSVDSEVALFSGTGGKTIKRASLTGIPYMTAGVLAAATSTNVISLFGSGSCSGYLKSDGTCDTPAGAGDVVGQASSVDSEVALFSGTGGKTIKRASLTGIPYMTSGVLGSATSTNIVALFGSGSCSGFLKSDGTCDTNAATATALAANGANCSAGQIPLGVTAAGAAEGCYAPAISTLSDGSSVVTLTGSQTLTNKTLTLPIVGAYTVAGLPAATTAGQLAIVTDGASTGNCTSGGGSSLALCRASGSAWVPLGDGGSGHTQNTDTGTTQTTFQIDSGNSGPKLKNNAGVLEARNAADDDYADFRAKTVSAGDGTVAGEIPLYELAANGTNYISWLAPDAITNTLRLKVPNADPAAQVLNCAAPSSNISTCTWQTPVTTSSSDTFTNKTVDAEGTGNAITIPTTVWLPGAGCNNATASSFWDLPTSTPAVPACVTGTNTQKGVLGFADTSGGFSAQNEYLLPDDFTGAIDAKIIWSTSATSGNAKWSLSTICTAVGATETDDPAFNTASTVTTAAPGTANRLQTSAITGVTATGCAAGEFLHVKIFRDGNDGSDTIAATANLVGVELKIRRAM